MSLHVIQFVIGGLTMVPYFTPLLLPFYSYAMVEGAIALVKENMSIIFDQDLPQWNYVATPKSS